MARRLWLFGAALVLGGCGDRPRFTAGDGCELNSDCSAPLVCRLDRCRVECRGLRDCPTGYLCYLDEDGLGACQLDDERDCTLTSECGGRLVCLFGQCANECESTSDCPAGTHCETAEDGTTGCVDDSEGGCELHSQCTAPRICAPDRRCREQCRENRDCRDNLVCIVMGGLGVCSTPPLDGGPMDGGIDAGPPDAGTDAGIVVPPSVGQLSAGGGHTCAARGGQVFCWGERASAGAGTFFSSWSPSVVSVADPIMITSGENHSCAGTATQLLCWGANDSLQLGRTTGGMDYDLTPAPVAGITAISAVGARSHTCALDAAGTVRCWGDNSRGQLGTGSTTPASSMSPLTVVLPMAAVDVTARGSHACAVLVDGTVHCWGWNRVGQLGQDPSITQSAMALPVPGLAGVLEVDAGSEHTCARTATEVWCWGANLFSQIARPSSMREPPSVIGGLTDVAEIEAGFAHTCARSSSGTVACWGDNSPDQQSGIAGMTIVASPMDVGLSNIEEIVTGDYHSCARDAAGTVSCWGNNSLGQLGDGTTGPHPAPEKVVVAFP